MCRLAGGWQALIKERNVRAAWKKNLRPSLRSLPATAHLVMVMQNRLRSADPSETVGFLESGESSLPPVERATTARSSRWGYKALIASVVVLGGFCVGSTVVALKIHHNAEKLAQCHLERDYGMISALNESQSTHCQKNGTEVTSTYTHYAYEDAGIRSTVFTNLVVDFRSTKVFKPIKKISQDGHRHDPRFKYGSTNVHCVCESAQNSEHGQPPVWNEIFAEYPGDNYDVCQLMTPQKQQLLLSNEPQDDTGAETHEVTRVKTNAIVLARRDDHNPFFQISAALNAWMMMKVVGWTPDTTQLVYLDDGFPSPIDILQRAILAPMHPVIPGRDLLKTVAHFDSVMIAPFEFSGPMMQHLNDKEPCGHNNLISDFRKHALEQMRVPLMKQDPTTCLVTIITRRPYDGRMVQRKWLNEDDVLDKMIREYAKEGVYKHSTCRFQSVDFVHLSLSAQMRLMVESDVVIGMHGAGMVNVLWTRPETLVIEIFPKKRYRWGYRNLCQFVGCRWHQFRGGEDIRTGKTANDNDKTIPYGEWHAFFHPLFRKSLGEMENRVYYELEGDYASTLPRALHLPLLLGSLGLIAAVYRQLSRREDTKSVN
ncbi:hypothetical protein Poli38472_010846 [Pythium oligandrum]|uniref:Glycosyltransferase 61 catalytic domain-containing protein n=1 Tax=Pythium oligandrum TaxID=41045 RepID=A0A8K1FKJ3_PYTOL|nr:hypothetical protein Poli38472_010846 [Pythium oligandrum]|eukprot:TMW61783.1 hypothetical protein Poli38472_010846 [Pythium oligandrum]